MTLTVVGAAAAGPALCWATPLSATPVRIASSSPSERKNHERSRIDFLLVVRDHHGGICKRVEGARGAPMGMAQAAPPVPPNRGPAGKAPVETEGGDRGTRAASPARPPVPPPER